MALRINDIAPDFTAQTTQGPIDFHQWIGDKWAILFSHPKDFTQVCTTELGYMAKIKPDFPKRGVKLIGLSSTRARLADHDLKASKLCEMLPAEEPGTFEGRTPATNQTMRTVYVIGPDKKIKLLLAYPMTTGRNFDEILRVIDSLQLTAEHKVSTPGQLKAW
jgi:thioredoxin-dependent peroxiredoxin